MPLCIPVLHALQPARLSGLPPTMAVLESQPHPVQSDPACHLPVELGGLGRPASGRRLEERSAMATELLSLQLACQFVVTASVCGNHSRTGFCGASCWGCFMLCPHSASHYPSLPCPALLQARGSPSHPCSLSHGSFSLSHLQPPSTRHHPASQGYRELLPQPSYSP